jgi:hypothetical protein
MIYKAMSHVTSHAQALPCCYISCLKEMEVSFQIALVSSVCGAMLNVLAGAQLRTILETFVFISKMILPREKVF